MTIRSSAPSNYQQRVLGDRVMRALTLVATLIALIPLILIIGNTTILGASALSIDFFTKTYEPPAIAGFDPAADLSDLGLGIPDLTDGSFTDPLSSTNGLPDLSGVAGGPAIDNLEDKGAGFAEATTSGGVSHAIAGTLLVTGLALLLSLPIGILAAIFLAEYPGNPVATLVRFATDVLSGTPSIIAGTVAYIVIVLNFRQFSGVAGAIALMFLMVPTITRTTEEVLRLVPETTREAALALGAPMWYSTFTVVVPTAITGIVTGVLLAFARGAGETAPLILTVLGNNEFTTNLLGPIQALPLITYRYTESPYPGENLQAWGSAFILMMLVLTMNILVRFGTRNRLKGR